MKNIQVRKNEPKITGKLQVNIRLNHMILSMFKHFESQKYNFIWFNLNIFPNSAEVTDNVISLRAQKEIDGVKEKIK